MLIFCLFFFFFFLCVWSVCAPVLRYTPGIVGAAVYQRMEFGITETFDYSTRWQSEFRTATKAEKGKLTVLRNYNLFSFKIKLYTKQLNGPSLALTMKCNLYAAAGRFEIHSIKEFTLLKEALHERNLANSLCLKVEKNCFFGLPPVKA